MFRKIFYPHSLIVTCLLFILIWFLDTIRINFHFLNPFNETIRDYEITDIVYSRLRDNKVVPDDRIALVNVGQPNRDTLHLIVDRIREAGAKVISIDIMLADRKNPTTDSLLQHSLRQMENIVLAVELPELPGDKEIFLPPINCDTFFCDWVYSGFINFITLDTSTIRHFSPREYTTEGECLAFATRTAKLYDPKSVERLFKRNNPIEEIYYTGNDDQFVQYETSDILNANKDTLYNRLHDKIVLIGFLGTYEWDNPLLDRHYTPLNPRYTGRNAPDMYGMVIHANIIRMILDNTYVRKPSFWVNLLLTVVFCYFNIHLFYEIFRRVSVPYQFITRFLQLGEIILLFFLVSSLFYFYRIKLDVAYWITALLLTFDAVKFYDNVILKRIPFMKYVPNEFPSLRKKGKRDIKPDVKPIQNPTSETDLPSKPTDSPK